MIRMQGAITSKNMLPRRRRVHLHKSASFKTIFDQIKKNHKKYAKNDPKMIENTKFRKNGVETNRNKFPAIRQTFRFWFPFWSQLLSPFTLWRVLFATCFSEPLGGTPLDRCWPPLGLPRSDSIDLLEDFGASLLQNSKIPEQQMAQTTPSKKLARIQNNLPITKPNKSLFTFC